ARKKRNSSQLCGPANRKTVTMEKPRGNQPATVTDSSASPIAAAAKERAERSATGLAAGQAASVTARLFPRSRRRRRRESRQLRGRDVEPDGIPRLDDLYLRFHLHRP